VRLFSCRFAAVVVARQDSVIWSSARRISGQWILDQWPIASSRAARITMMQAADLRERDDLAPLGQLDLARQWSVAIEGLVAARIASTPRQKDSRDASRPLLAIDHLLK